MKNGIAEIDHLLCFVASLGDASRSFERLGFLLSPRSEVSSLGIANRLALMNPRTAGAASFIELMAPENPGKLPPAMAATLSGRQGIKSMVMMTRDAAAAYQEMRTNGYPILPPMHLRREWVIPDEGSVWPEFDVIQPVDAPLVFNACQYHNVDLYLRADWQAHPNGARTLNRVFAAARDIRPTVGFFEKLFGVAAVPQTHGGMSISPGATRLTLYPADQLPARFGGVAAGHADAGPDSATYVGYQLGVSSLALTRRQLEKGGVPYVHTASGLAVAPDHACGNLLEFVEHA